MKKKLIPIVILLFFSILVFLVIHYSKEKEIVLEIGIYSGNEWEVPQIDVYKIYEEAIKQFEAENPNVKIVFRSGTLMEDYSEWLAQKVLKGEEPDIFIVLEEDFNTFADIGMLEPLNDYIEDESDIFLVDYYEKALEAGNYNGIQFAMPFEIVPTFMIVNKTLLDSNGISFPEVEWNLDTFMDISRILTKDTDSDKVIDQYGSVGYEWDHAYYSVNGNFNEGLKAIDIYDEVKLSQAIDFTKSLYLLNQGYNVTNTDFSEGNVGFKPFSLAEFRAYKPYPYRVKKYSNFDWEAIPFPVFNDNQSQAKLYTVQIGMSSRSKEKELSWEFIKFLTSDSEIQQMVWDTTYTLPTKISVVDNLYLNQNNSEDILDPEFLKSIIEQSVVEPTFKEYNQIRDAMNIRIKLNILENKSAQETIREVRKDIEDLLFDIE